MRIWTLLSGVILLLIAGTLASAEVDQDVDSAVVQEVVAVAHPDIAVDEAQAAPADAVAWDDFAAPEFVPGESNVAGYEVSEVDSAE